MASTLLDELTGDLQPAGVNGDLVSATSEDKMLQTVRSWVESGKAPPWSECAGLAPELRCWRLQIGNLNVDSLGRLWRRRSPPSVGSQLVVPVKKRQDFIKQFHDSLFAGHLGITRTVFRLQHRVYWPGIRGDVQTYIQSCTTCIARKSPCPRKVPMGHVKVGHRWERVAMDLLDMSVTTSRGNRYVLVMVDCFTRWTEAFPLPDKTAQSVADAFFNQVICRFGMPSVIHSDQGREFENKIMQELCLLGGAHKTRTTPYHPKSDGMVERFNRTLLMMLAMFAGKNRDDWDDLLPAVMMAYRSSVHESTGFSPYRLMFGEECTLPMDIGLPRDQLDTSELQGVQPRLQLLNSPWGHGAQCVEKCDCLMSDRVDAYVHCLIPRVAQADLTNLDNIDNSGEMAAGFTFSEDCGYLGISCAGSIPFVSEKPGAYGRLLLAVYVRWKSGCLISSDWLRPVTRGAWRAVLSERVDEPNPVHGSGESS